MQDHQQPLEFSKLPAATLPAAPAPVPAPSRFLSIDVLRGFALMGILTMNISMGQPGVTRLNPTISGGFMGANLAVWWLGYLFFDEKMVSIFSMLFGAGLVLMAQRMEAAGRSPTAFFYRRAAVLLGIGLVHAYLIWEGDILVSYALAGMIVYLFRKKSPRALLGIAVLFWIPSVPLSHAFSTVLAKARSAASNGQAPDKDLIQLWQSIQAGFHPTAEQIAQDIRAHRDPSYVVIARRRAPEAFMVETLIFGLSIGWTTCARMLAGMALMKLGVLSAARSRRFYFWMALLGYGLGWPLVVIGGAQLIRHRFDVVYLFGGGIDHNDIGSIGVALAHIATVLLIYKAGALQWLTKRLAAAGRIALSNYLMQSLICTTLFYGYGFGLFGSLDRVRLLGLVVAIWALQLWYSPLWLLHYRFGPVEWLWRSLTYGKRQPMLFSCLPHNVNKIAPFCHTTARAKKYHIETTIKSQRINNDNE